MRIAPQAIVILLFPTLLLLACAREEPRTVPAAARPSYPQQPRPAPQAPSSAAYVAAAASIDLLEIRSAELALQRSNRTAVREFASMMIAAHKGTSAQLSLAGRRLNLLPSAILSPKHQTMFDSLQAAMNFDSGYRQLQLTLHQEALALHSAYASNGTSPTLRPVAAAIVPVIQRHLRMIRYL